MLLHRVGPLLTLNRRLFDLSVQFFVDLFVSTQKAHSWIPTGPAATGKTRLWTPVRESKLYFEKLLFPTIEEKRHASGRSWEGNWRDKRQVCQNKKSRKAYQSGSLNIQYTIYNIHYTIHNIKYNSGDEISSSHQCTIVQKCKNTTWKYVKVAGCIGQLVPMALMRSI